MTTPLDLAAAAIWTTYTILANIAEQQGDTPKAAEYRHRAREARMGFMGTRHELRRHGQLMAAVVAAKQGDAQAAEGVPQILEALRQGGGDWTRLADALQHLLAGGYQAEMLARQGDLQSIILETILQGIEHPETLQDLLQTDAT